MITNHPETENYLTATARVFADLERIPETARTTSGVCGEWTLRDLMGHLGFWDGHVADSLTAKRDGTDRPRFRETHDAVNAREQQKRAGWGWDEVMAEVATNRERLLPLMIDPGEDPDYGIHEHWEEHGAQIASFADRVSASREENSMDPAAISAQYARRVQQTLDVVDRFPVERREEPGVVGRWSLKDLMGHLAFWDGVNRAEMEAEQAGREIVSDDRDDDTINAEAWRVRKDWSWDQIVAELIDNRDARIELEKLPSQYDHSGAGEHWDEHREQIEAWLARGGQSSGG